MPREFIDRAHLTIHVFAQDMIFEMAMLRLHVCIRGSPYTSQISHLLHTASFTLATSPWIEQPILPYFHTITCIQPAFEVSTGRLYIWEMAIRFCKLLEPLLKHHRLLMSSILVGQPGRQRIIIHKFCNFLPQFFEAFRMVPIIRGECCTNLKASL